MILATAGLTVLAGFSASAIWTARQDNLVKVQLVEKSVLELTNQFHDAVIRQDIGMLRHIASDNLVWSEGKDMLNWNKSELLRAVESGYVKYKTIVVDDIKIDINGNEAIMRGDITVLQTFSVDRHRSEHESRHPLIYRFGFYQDRWQIVSTRYRAI